MKCVVCLSESEDLIGIFNEDGKNLEIAAILKKHLQFIEVKFPILKSFCLFFNKI